MRWFQEGIQVELISTCDDNNNCMPLGFVSRILKKNENNLAINYLETLAIIEGYADFDHLLHGRKLVIIIDDKPAADTANCQHKRLLTPMKQLVNVVRLL